MSYMQFTESIKKIFCMVVKNIKNCTTFVYMNYKKSIVLGALRASCISLVPFVCYELLMYAPRYLSERKKTINFLKFTNNSKWITLQLSYHSLNAYRVELFMHNFSKDMVIHYATQGVTPWGIFQQNKKYLQPSYRLVK
jgi:hypothetical protein